MLKYNLRNSKAFMNVNPDQLILGEHIDLFGELENLSNRIGNLVFASDINHTNTEALKLLDDLTEVIVEVVSTNPKVNPESFKFHTSNSATEYYVEFEINGMVVLINIPYNTTSNPEIIVMFNSPLRLIFENNAWVVHEYIPGTKIPTIIQSLDILEDEFAVASTISLNRRFEETGRTDYQNITFNGLRVREGYSYVDNRLAIHTYTWNLPNRTSYQFIGTPNKNGWEYKYYKIFPDEELAITSFNAHLRTILTSKQMEYGDLVEAFMNPGVFSVECSTETHPDMKTIDVEVSHDNGTDVFGVDMGEDEMRCYLNGETIAVFTGTSLRSSFKQNIEGICSVSFEISAVGDEKIKRFYFMTEGYMLVLELNHPFVMPSLIFSNI
jgi:hypothetical protein